MKKNVIFGNNNIAKMLCQDLLRCGSDFKVVAFCVDDEYLTGDTFLGLPQLSFLSACSVYPPSDFNMISTVNTTTALRSRLDIFRRIKDAGYHMPNYVSPMADVSPEIEMGENNIIMAQAHVGLGGKMGDFNLIRQGAYIGHDFHLGDNNVFAPRSIGGGHLETGNNSYFGLGSIVIDNISIADDTFIGAGAVVIRHTQAATLYVGNPARAIKTHHDTGIIFCRRT